MTKHGFGRSEISERTEKFKVQQKGANLLTLDISEHVSLHVSMIKAAPLNLELLGTSRLFVLERLSCRVERELDARQATELIGLTPPARLPIRRFDNTIFQGGAGIL